MLAVMNDIGFRKGKLCRILGIIANNATEVEEDVNLAEVNNTNKFCPNHNVNVSES